LTYNNNNNNNDKNDKNDKNLQQSLKHIKDYSINTQKVPNGLLLLQPNLSDHKLVDTNQLVIPSNTLPIIPNTTVNKNSNSSTSSSIGDMYANWVKKNATWLLPLEDILRSLTIFIPGRFSDTEVFYEAVYTFLNLLSVYHDRILARPRAVVCELKCTVETSATARIKNILILFHYTEVLIEMVAARIFAGELIPVSCWTLRAKGKWMIVALVELLKVYCRLRILHDNKGRMLVTPTPEQVIVDLEKKKKGNK